MVPPRSKDKVLYTQTRYIIALIGSFYPLKLLILKVNMKLIQACMCMFSALQRWVIIIKRITQFLISFHIFGENMFSCVGDYMIFLCLSSCLFFNAQERVSTATNNQYRSDKSEETQVDTHSHMLTAAVACFYAPLNHCSSPPTSQLHLQQTIMCSWTYCRNHRATEPRSVISIFDIWCLTRLLF